MEVEPRDIELPLWTNIVITRELLTSEARYPEDALPSEPSSDHRETYYYEKLKGANYY